MAASNGVHGLRCLLLEDDLDDAELFRLALTRAPEGARPRLEPVTRVEQAVARLAAERFDVILMDMHLPDAQGLDAFRRIKAAAGRTAIIVLTGFKDDELARVCVQEGAKAFLAKSEAIQPGVLAGAIAAAMSPPRRLDVLIVEDNASDVKLLKAFIKESGFPCELHAVTDGEQATDFLFRRGAHAHAPRPGVILLDINLPRKNGFEILAELRGTPELRNIPVIILTSSHNEEDIARSNALQAAAFFTKPADLDGFEAIVRKLVTVEFPRFLRPG